MERIRRYTREFTRRIRMRIRVEIGERRIVGEHRKYFLILGGL